jgi:hypothetical protein
MPSITLAIALMLSPLALAQPPQEITAVRLDNTFRLVGSDSSGLVVAVKIGALKRPASSGDFTLVIFDAQGHRSGETACLAIRRVDGSGSKQPWVLLDDQNGTLSRSYRSLIESGAAVVEKQRSKALDQAGNYEFVFVIGPTVKQGALAYGENRPDVARVPIGSFKVPWP